MTGKPAAAGGARLPDKAPLRGELEAVDRGQAPLLPPGPVAATAGARWLPRPLDRATQLRPDAEAIAAHGEFDATRRTCERHCTLL